MIDRIGVRRWLGVVAMTASSALAANACSPAPFDTPVDGSGAAEGGTGSTAAECDTTSPKKLEPMAPSSLPGCCAEGATGAAHCVPQGKVPNGFRKAMAPCTGGFCIPDALIKSGGAAPPSCKSAFGDGACLSVCIPNIAAKKDLLEKAGCAGEDEKCAPCISPLDNKPTGACDVGKPHPEDDACKAGGGGTGASSAPAPSEAAACPYTGPLVDVSKFMECDPKGARCVPESSVPEAQRAMLAKCTTGYCVPDPILAHKGQYIPATCSSTAGAEGRCLHISLPVVAAKASLLPQDTCSGDEKCVPCTDPIEGKETGACKIACDPGPTKPPVKFASCCDGLAKCVPSSIVPAAQRSSLNSDGCKATDKCVPTEMLGGALKAQKCTASFLAGGGPGVCLSNCIELGLLESIAITRGDCDKDHQCVPCTKDGKPSGAPGCD